MYPSFMTDARTRAREEELALAVRFAWHLEPRRRSRPGLWSWIARSVSGAARSATRSPAPQVLCCP